MNLAMPVSEVILFGSHARGEARADSDVDLCVVTVGAAEQFQAARKLRQAMRPIRPKPSFTLIPISPERLGEKKERGDHFFQTVLSEGVLLASKN
jgi:predicted nucleotidyltransferase